MALSSQEKTEEEPRPTGPRPSPRERRLLSRPCRTRRAAAVQRCPLPLQPATKENTMPTIADVMTKGVEVIGPEESLQHAAQLMDELNVGALPVCNGSLLLGIVTDRDITVRATAAGMDPNEACVSDVMSEQVRWCSENDSTDSVMDIMGDTQIRRLPVLNDERELVGIVSLGDLATRLGGHIDTAVRKISMPSQPDR